MPKILVTNDDGVHSPGLHAAVDGLYGLADVEIVAPLHQQTAMGRALTGNKASAMQPVPLSIGGRDYQAYACDASPAFAVRHGLSCLPSFSPDLVVSGINYGENLGSSITGSGTVGAALQGAGQGIPSIAISLETSIDTIHDYSEQEWDVAAHFLRLFAGIMLGNSRPMDVDVLKIDVPCGATLETPWRLTRLSPDSYYGIELPKPSLSSQLGDYRITKAVAEGEPKDTDVHALAVDKVVSVTPLSLDCTSRERFSVINSWLGGA
ncbi:5'/3'-nucleotidase SurE [Desulfovibrio ferrophilus]|uniref:5'-nucleotidase SurE n=1 Tax=Desulfovibrio ferrophilus TaxID=241368 RepID=A0A2Z6AYF6_9BACT|nr:5'/3'-nucleotidase SurE [Desulfovibrio ferrophilus]BBD08297.1 stationary-phase survival protein SurE [Desulfovibrio ferrophilus]